VWILSHLNSSRQGKYVNEASLGEGKYANEVGGECKYANEVGGECKYANEVGGEKAQSEKYLPLKQEEPSLTPHTPNTELYTHVQAYPCTWTHTQTYKIKREIEKWKLARPT